jgi:hypothetical protein
VNKKKQKNFVSLGRAGFTALHRADAVKAGKPISTALLANVLKDQKRQRQAAEYVGRKTNNTG